jgi:hypothetical protein
MAAEHGSKDWMADKLDRIWAVVDEWGDEAMPGNDAMSAIKDIIEAIMPEEPQQEDGSS